MPCPALFSSGVCVRVRENSDVSGENAEKNASWPLHAVEMTSSIISYVK